jgi:hypothetical protein
MDRVAVEANLCLSVIHLLELAAWPNLAEAEAVAQWLDRVPVVWMRKLDSILTDEAEHWLQVALGLTPAPVQAFAPSMWAAFEKWTPSTAAVALEHASLPEAVQLFRAMQYSRGNELAKVAAQAFRADRSQVTGWSEAQKAERVGYNRRVELRKIARATHLGLEARGNPAYDALKQTGGGVMDPFVDFVERTPFALPAWRTMGTFTAGFADIAVRRTAGSKKDGELDSSMNDVQHAALGIYCDVFTCDKLTSTILGDLRTTLGRARQFSVGEMGDATRFVDALTGRLPLQIPST